MKGCDGIKIETVRDLPTDQLNNKFCQLNVLHSHPLRRMSLNGLNNSPTNTSSIALTNYDFQPTSRLIIQLPIEPTLPKFWRFVTQLLSTTNNKASTLLICFERVNSLWFPLQRLSVDSLLPNSGRIDTQLPSMNWVCSYFEGFSQTTACTATSFWECSSTLLDRLWYLYSYIYEPTTIQSGNLYILNFTTYKSILVIAKHHAYYYSFCIYSLIYYKQFYYSKHIAVTNSPGVCICPFLINYLGYLFCEFHQIYHLPISGQCLLTMKIMILNHPLDPTFNTNLSHYMPVHFGYWQF